MGCCKMLFLTVAVIWWLLVGQSAALPRPVLGASSSSVAPVVINSDYGGNSGDNQTLSSFSKNNSVPAFVGNTNSTAAAGSQFTSTHTPGKIRSENFNSTAPISRTNTSPCSSGDAVNSIPATSGSTASGYTSSSSTQLPPTQPDYAPTLAELLSAITAEFVFNVAGDHVLFPAAEDAEADRSLHTTAAVVAELLQKLHISPQVYRMLNTSACAVVRDMRQMRQRGANPVAEVVRLTAEAALQDPLVRDEFAAVRQRLANQIFSLPAQHGKFAATGSQTLYEVTGEQLAYAETLMKDVRVKKLVMSVTFFKASQFDETSVPEWVRQRTSLARAAFELAKEARWRDEVQRAFDEAVADSVTEYDAMADDDEIVFRILGEKIGANAALSAELQRMGVRWAQTKT